MCVFTMIQLTEHSLILISLVLSYFLNQQGGDYKMRSMAAVAASLGRAVASSAAPAQSLAGSMSSAGTPPLHDNPLAALMASPDKENTA